MNGHGINSIMASKYTLTYFNFRARAELARLIFAVAKVEYEDERIRPEAWLDEYKPYTPFGQLPVLRVDGHEICQSHTIARYLAREFGLAGKTSLEQARTDMVVECIDDMMRTIMPAFREKNEAKKNAMRRTYADELPVFMGMMEKLLISNNGGDEYFVGDEMTWADLAVMNCWHWIPGFGVTPELAKYPKLNEHKKRIESQPQVADWIKRRPITPV